MHRSLPELRSLFEQLPATPQESGRVAAIVCRSGGEVHESREWAELSVAGGLVGDKWAAGKSRKRDAQIAVMRRDIAELVGAGQPLTTAGDNLIVDFDLSTSNLPVGARLAVGRAVIEVTAMPHDGCSKFARRFGRDAMKFVNAPDLRHLNLRGIYCRVIESGTIETGDRILRRSG